MSNTTHPAWTRPNVEPIPRVSLRPAEAAIAIGVSERTLHSWLKSGDIPAVKRGQCWLIPLESLRNWLAEQVEQPSDKEADA